MRRGAVVAGLALVLCTAFEARSQGDPTGDPIPVANAGFENPALPRVGDFTVGSVPSWQLYDPDGLVARGRADFGVWRPTRNDFLTGAAEGQNIVYLSSDAVGEGTFGVEQTLPETLEADRSYTLEVKVGNVSPVFPEFESFPGFRVELLAGGELLAATQNSPVPPEGLFSTARVLYTAGPTDPRLDQPLRIRLINLLSGPGLDADFDDVKLTKSSALVETVRFRFLDSAGALAGTFSYERNAGDTQIIPGTASLFITEATGDLAPFADFDFTGGVLNAGGNVLQVGVVGVGTFFSLAFGQPINLANPLPIESFRPAASLVLLDGSTVVDGAEADALLFLPEPGVWAVLIAVAALAVLRAVAHRSRRGPLHG